VFREGRDERFAVRRQFLVSGHSDHVVELPTVLPRLPEEGCSESSWRGRYLSWIVVSATSFR
jgi:hypothetical protein